MWENPSGFSTGGLGKGGKDTRRAEDGHEFSAASEIPAPEITLPTEPGGQTGVSVSGGGTRPNSDGP